MSNKKDLKISGASTMPGGDYCVVTISGSGKVDGNLCADSIICSGSSKILGNVCYAKPYLLRLLSFKRRCSNKDMRVAGSLKI